MSDAAAQAGQVQSESLASRVAALEARVALLEADVQQFLHAFPDEVRRAAIATVIKEEIAALTAEVHTLAVLVERLVADEGRQQALLDALQRHDDAGAILLTWVQGRVDEEKHLADLRIAAEQRARTKRLGRDKRQRARERRAYTWSQGVSTPLIIAVLATTLGQLLNGGGVLPPRSELIFVAVVIAAAVAWGIYWNVLRPVPPDDAELEEVARAADPSPSASAAQEQGKGAEKP